MLDGGGVLAPGLAPQVDRQAEYLALAQQMLEVQRGQIIELSVGRQRHQVADTAQLHMLGGVFGQRVTVVGREPLGAGGLHRVPARVGQQHAESGLAQTVGHLPGHRVGADDQHAVGRGAAHLQPVAQRTGQQTLGYDRGDDHQKGHRHQTVGAGHTDLFQPQREQRGHRGGDDAAGRDERQQTLLAPVQAAAQGAQPHRQRTHQQQQHRQKGPGRPAQQRQLLDRQTCRQQDEQTRDQKDRQGLLELDDRSGGHATHIGEPGAHYCYRQQAGLVKQGVGQGEQTEHGHQGAEAVQPLRQQVLAQYLAP